MLDDKIATLSKLKHGKAETGDERKKTATNVGESLVMLYISTPLDGLFPPLKHIFHPSSPDYLAK